MLAIHVQRKEACNGLLKKYIAGKIFKLRNKISEKQFQKINKIFKTRVK